jgi:hypothetical protein
MRPQRQIKAKPELLILAGAKTPVAQRFFGSWRALNARRQSNEDHCHSPSDVGVAMLALLRKKDQFYEGFQGMLLMQKRNDCKRATG